MTTELGPVDMSSHAESMTVIPVLEFLNGLAYGPEILCYVSALRPSRVVIVRNAIDCMAIPWRVRIWLDQRDCIRLIEQEVIFSLYGDQCENGADLTQWLWRVAPARSNAPSAGTTSQ